MWTGVDAVEWWPEAVTLPEALALRAVPWPLRFAGVLVGTAGACSPPARCACLTRISVRWMD